MKTEDPPKALSFIEVLRVVHASEMLNIDQHKLAAMYGINAGRIAEAVVTLRWAAENHKMLYRYIQRLKGRHRKAEGAKKEEEAVAVAVDLHHQLKLFNGSPQ
jgi:hypothetical protein